jgi:small subunit ribosomal protein S16
MLAIRMQRNGRKGHAMFRVIVQDAQRTPTSGRVAAYLGSYDPHAKKVLLDKEKIEFYLEHGARPSMSVVRLLKAEKVKLPKWVSEASLKEGKIKNPDKRRSTTPKMDNVDVASSTDENPKTVNDDKKQELKPNNNEAQETKEEASKDLNVASE